MRRLIPSLGDYDLVGFQTDGDAANFARYLAKELGTPSHISLRLGTRRPGDAHRHLSGGDRDPRIHPPGAARGEDRVGAAGAAIAFPAR